MEPSLGTGRTTCGRLSVEGAEQLTRANIAEQVIKRFPVLKADVLRVAQEEGVGNEALNELGIHLLFGDVFNPCIVRLLADRVTATSIRAAFDFLEELAASEDEQLTEVVAVTVCERLGDDEDILHSAVQEMGPHTRALAKKQEAGWGRRYSEDPIWQSNSG